MPREDWLYQDGVVTKDLGNGRYMVQFTRADGGTYEQHATICGKMRVHFIRILSGDPVTVGFSPYDLKRGVITRREKV